MCRMDQEPVGFITVGRVGVETVVWLRRSMFHLPPIKMGVVYISRADQPTSFCKR